MHLVAHPGFSLSHPTSKSSENRMNSNFQIYPMCDQLLHLFHLVQAVFFSYLECWITVKSLLIGLLPATLAPSSPLSLQHPQANLQAKSGCDSPLLTSPLIVLRIKSKAAWPAHLHMCWPRLFLLSQLRQFSPHSRYIHLLTIPCTLQVHLTPDSFLLAGKLFSQLSLQVFVFSGLFWPPYLKQPA